MFKKIQKKKGVNINEGFDDIIDKEDDVLKVKEDKVG